MNRRAILLFIMTLIIVSVFFVLATDALPLPLDVGNNTDYSGGSDWGGSSDYGSSGWDSSYSGSGGNYDSDNGGFGLAIGIVIVVIIIIVFSKKKAGQLNKSTGGSSLSVIPADNTRRIIDALLPIDPYFNADKFIAWTKEVFITLQEAWTARDWSKIRPFEKEELYAQHQKQLQEYINNGTINVIERINVGQTYLQFYQRDPNYEIMKVYMQVRMNDYVIDEKTRAVVKGNANTEYHMAYLLTFIRKTGVKTDPVKSNASTVSCPFCGAPVSITSAGKCEYCDHIITTGEHDWVLSNLESIRGNTLIDNRGVVIIDNSQNK